MRRRLEFGLILASAAWLGLAGSAPVRGAFDATLAETTTFDSATNNFLYQYTITNNADSTLPVSSVFLSVDPTANLSAIVGPTGFDVSYKPGDPTTGAPGDPSINFTSPSSAVDIQPGKTDTFSFESPERGIQQPYAFQSLDSTGAFAGQTPDGLTALSPVPEPASLLLVALGGLGMLGYGRLRRKPKPAA